MTFLDGIMHYWPIIVFCGSVIGQWVRAEMQISDLKDCVKDLNEEIKTLNTKVTIVEKSADTFRESVQVTLAQISTNLDYIKEFIKEIKNK